jgi:hypothetical protein
VPPEELLKKLEYAFLCVRMVVAKGESSIDTFVRPSQSPNRNLHFCADFEFHPQAIEEITNIGRKGQHTVHMVVFINL